MANLATLDEYKVYKAIVSDELNSQHEAILTHVSQLIKTYCDRTFIDNYTVDLVDKFDATSNSSVFVSEFPIKDITSIETTVDSGITLVPLVEGTDYFLKKDIGQITTGDGTPFLDAAVPPFNSLIVTYTGGFSSTPEDLKLAAMDLVHYYVTSSFNPNKRLGSASIDTVSFSKLGDSAFPPHIKRVLDLYRSIRV